MKQIKQTTVASGIISEYAHEWAVIKLHDTKYDSTSYELFINEGHVFSGESVVECLAVLVDEFSK